MNRGLANAFRTGGCYNRLRELGRLGSLSIAETSSREERRGLTELDCRWFRGDYSLHTLTAQALSVKAFRPAPATSMLLSPRAHLGEVGKRPRIRRFFFCRVAGRAASSLRYLACADSLATKNPRYSPASPESLTTCAGHADKSACMIALPANALAGGRDSDRQCGQRNGS